MIGPEGSGVRIVGCVGEGRVGGRGVGAGVGAWVGVWPGTWVGVWPGTWVGVGAITVILALPRKLQQST
jgi:hypothetical protein